MTAPLLVALLLVDGTPLWRQLPTAGTALSAAFGYRGALDRDRRRLMVADSYSGNTWEYELDTGKWALRQPSVHPPGRFDPAMAYDPVRRVIVLFGGLSDNGPFPDQRKGLLQDTWVWSSPYGTWTEMRPDGPLPAARSSAGMVYDPDRQALILTGGLAEGGDLADPGTWQWDGTRWLALPSTNAPTGSCALVYDPGTRRVLATVPGVDRQRLVAWTGSPPAWTEVASEGAPPPRRFPAAVFDPGRGKVLLFGGLGGGAQPNDDLWEWGGAAPRWAQAARGAPWPAAREGAMAFWDDDNRRILLFGGSSAFPSSAQTVLTDLWALDVKDLPLGAGCSGAEQCPSQLCVDGVCCESSCTGTCKSCNAASPGMCLDAPPRAADPTASPPCEAPRSCDGHGACVASPPSPPDAAEPNRGDAGAGPVAAVDGPVGLDARASADADGDAPTATTPAGAIEQDGAPPPPPSDAGGVPAGTRGAVTVARRGLYGGGACTLARAPISRSGGGAVLVFAVLVGAALNLKPHPRPRRHQ